MAALGDQQAPFRRRGESALPNPGVNAYLLFAHLHLETRTSQALFTRGKLKVLHDTERANPQPQV
jgi:hypothetical protein